ncbi:MAG: hypothetical protein P8183_00230, partial [Anaerolineae bacterium]
MKTVLIHPLITKEQKIVPLLPQKAIWHFLLAGLAVRLAIYHFLPFLTAQGLTPFEAFVVSFIAPLAILFALAFGTVQAEGVPMTAQAFARRFRFRRLIIENLIRFSGVSVIIFITL